MHMDYMLIKQFCELYHTELTVLSSMLAEHRELANYSDYIKFLEDLSIEEFVGSYLVNLFVDVGLEMYDKVLKGDLKFDDFVIESCKPILFLYDYKDFYNKYKKKLKEYRAK